MRIIPVVLACAIAAGSAAVAELRAQAPAPEKTPDASAAPSQQPRALVPLKVQIVLTRFRGEKKIGSLPYSFAVTANEPRGKTSLRMGVQVPVKTGASTFNYREVGTNIDCTANSEAGDSYRLNLVVEDSSIHLEGAKQGEPSNSASTTSDAPAFRSFKVNFTIITRDGQTTQYTSAVDPFSGEVMKVDVTVNVVK